MKLKNKLMLLGMTLFILGVCNTNSVFAIDDNSDNKENESNDYYYAGENAYPYWTDYLGIYENRQFTFVVHDEPKIVERNLDGFKYMTLNQNNQIIQLPYNNKNNPLDLTPMQNESDFVKVLELKENRRVETDPLKYKVRWETDMGFPYRTVYPKNKYTSSWMIGTKNQNFKDQGVDIQTMLPIVNGGVRPIKNQGLMGIVPAIVDYAQGGQPAHFIFYAPDLVNKSKGWTSDNRNLVANPEDVYAVIEKGAVQFQYERGMLSDEEAELWYLDIYYYFPGMKQNLINKGAKSGDPTTNTVARTSQTKYYFKYSNNLELPTKYVNGRAQIGYLQPTGEYAYATLTTPSIVPINNLKFYDMKLIDADTNQDISFSLEKDVKYGQINTYKVPSSTEKVKIQWRYGYLDAEQKNIDVMSLNTQIITNLYFYDKDMKDTFSKQSILGDKKDKLRGYFAVNFIEYMKKAKELGIADFDSVTKTYPELIKFREEELDTFEVTIPVSELESIGYIMSNTPWQFNGYFETKEYSGRTIYADNSTRVDDVGYVKYELQAPPQKDIKLQSVTGFGTWNETLKKYEITPGATYQVKAEIMNNGSADTTRTNPNLTFMTDKLNYGALEVRVNNTNKTNPKNPKILKKDSTETLNYQMTITIPSDLSDGDSFNLGVAIHADEDEFDNYFIASDDFIQLSGVVVSAVKVPDIGISDMYLTANGYKFTTKIEDPNTRKMDSNISNYTLNIVVEKYNVDGSVTNPKVILDMKNQQTDPAFTEINLTGTGTLKNKGDKITITYPVTTNTNYFDFIGEINDAYHLKTIPPSNIDNSNDKYSVKYVAGQDFMVSDVIVSPEKLNLPTGTTSISSKAAVTAKINVRSYGAGLFNDVQITLKRITPSGASTLIETKTGTEADLTTGMNYLTFNVSDYNYLKGNYAYIVEVNQNRKFYENDYTNNKGAAVIQVVDNPVPVDRPYCWGGSSYTRNDWEIRHNIIEREKYWRTCTRCIAYDINASGNRVCTEREYYDCCLGNSQTFNANPYPKAYYETLKLDAYTRSAKSDWNFDKGDGTVNAGRAYEIKWELKYYTTRTAYPRTENLKDNGECGGDTTVPSVTSYTFNTPLYLEDSNGTQYVLSPSMTSGTWSNIKVTYEMPTQTDALGDFTKKQYTDLNAPNSTITYRAWTDKLRGYPLTFGEDNGTNQPLIDCETTKIYIKDAIDVDKKTVE